MNYIETIFWISIALLFYSYVGYGMIVYGILRVRNLFNRKKERPNLIKQGSLPNATILIAAYNEIDCISEKVQNTLALEYPENKLQVMFVTDGSDDGTPDLLKRFDGIEVLHQDKRQGKIAAINRAMRHVQTPIVVFSDANTLLNKSAIWEITKHYQNPKVGAVAGEKRIKQTAKDSASGAGEGLYWKYESFLKKLDSDLYTVVGAAGEIFSIRTDLFNAVDADTILDDFIISLRIAQKGYRVMYEPNAYAIEEPCFSMKEEFTRKVRICAGGFQSVLRLKELLNPFRYGILSFQYFSHRVLRWVVNPFVLLALLPINCILMLKIGGNYTFLFVAQSMFYLLSILGWRLKKKKLRVKLLFAPYYFSMMNFAALIGFIRFIRNKQSVLWEKAKRVESKAVVGREDYI